MTVDTRQINSSSEKIIENLVAVEQFIAIDELEWSHQQRIKTWNYFVKCHYKCLYSSVFFSLEILFPSHLTFRQC